MMRPVFSGFGSSPAFSVSSLMMSPMTTMWQPNVVAITFTTFFPAPGMPTTPMTVFGFIG